MHFEFASVTTIVFGPGRSREIPSFAAALGRRVFVVTDSQERSRFLLDGLRVFGLVYDVFLVTGEPDVSCVVLATRNAQEHKAQIIIGFGGGSALDTGKAVAALMVNPGSPLDYMEVVGAGHTLGNPSIPYLAVPTTAGTGSEVTRNAVINVQEYRVKASLRSHYMLPRIAVIDPDLTFSLPPSITASTGMDALTQLIEPFVCNSPTPITDALCREGIARATRSLHKAYRNGLEAESRQDMALASLFGGLSLANARLGAVHGMANPIGGRSFAPHGAICARLLPLVMEMNIRALRSRQPDSPAITRYTEIARLLTGKRSAKAEDGIAWVKNLCKALDIRPLADYGLQRKDFPTLVSQSQMSSSMKGNPITLTDSELLTILSEAA